MTLEGEFDDSIATSLSKAIEACHKASIFMVGLYSLEKSAVIYINEKLKTALGYNYDRCKAEGLDFLYSLIQQDRRNTIRTHISKFLNIPILHSRIVNRYAITLNNETRHIRHEIVVQKLEGHLIAINYLLDISEKEEIERTLGILEHKNQKTELRQTVTDLSKRHKEILQLVSDGYTTKEIADLLCISSHTVSVHRKNLMHKFEVKNTAQLIKKAWSGILS